MKKKLQELIQKQVLILDGAMGTEIQKRENIKWGRNAKGESLAGCTVLSVFCQPRGRRA